MNGRKLRLLFDVLGSRAGIVFSYICSAGMICGSILTEEDSPRSGDFFAPLKSPFLLGCMGMLQL